jgi:hypothetical protein
MAEGRIWNFPIVTALRERIRARTPGELPPIREEHPFMGLIHDVQRLARRKVFGGR